MDGTTPLVFNRVGMINRTHVFAKPVQQYWPRLQYDAGYPKPHFPRMIDTDMCVGDNHITLHKVNNWSVTSGSFDPISLYTTMLQRDTNDNAQTTQTLSGLSTNTTYNISLTGDATISFSGGTGTQYSWNGSAAGFTNSIIFSDNSATVSFTNDTPDVISVKLNNNTQTVSKILMINNTTGQNIVRNSDFSVVDEHFYSIEEWYSDSFDNNIVPTDTLGYLQGFNDALIFSIFE